MDSCSTSDQHEDGKQGITANLSHVDSAEDVETGEGGGQSDAGQLPMPPHFFHFLLSHVNKQQLRRHGRLVRFYPAILKRRKGAI